MLLMTLSHQPQSFQSSLCSTLQPYSITCCSMLPWPISPLDLKFLVCTTTSFLLSLGQPHLCEFMNMLRGLSPITNWFYFLNISIVAYFLYYNIDCALSWHPHWVIPKDLRLTWLGWHCIISIAGIIWRRPDYSATKKEILSYCNDKQ